MTKAGLLKYLTNIRVFLPINHPNAKQARSFLSQLDKYIPQNVKVNVELTSNPALQPTIDILYGRLVAEIFQ
jgi:hypothetical protein